MTTPITPADDVFLLAHFGVPDIDPVGWTIEIDGMVRRPMSITIDELMRRPKRVIQSFHECAGNPVKPRQALRAVANVVWGGADLQELLAEAGPLAGGRFLWSYGADYGDYEATHNEAYLKDLPFERIEEGGVLLAYEMNGVPLTVEHGAPVRLFVPGYYGTNSVKWLRRITLAGRRADGPLTTVLYNDDAGPSPESSGSVRVPVWQIAPESVIVIPPPDTSLRAGELVEVRGWAWAANGVASVEVSVDGGATYYSAALSRREQWSWQRFSFDWRPSAPGAATLVSRATDFAGVVQPQAGARNDLYKVSVNVSA